MNKRTRLGEFYRVSYEQFLDAMNGLINDGCVVAESIQKLYENISIPSRATCGSAGYDFKSPFTFMLAPGHSIKIPTGIRVKIDEGWWLGCLPRSGLGFKYRLQLDNTMGVIDSDYYYSDNEGHIFAKVTNDGLEGKAVSIEAGVSFMQAILLPYGITYSDDAKGVRNGGMGSTGS